MSNPQRPALLSSESAPFPDARRIPVLAEVEPARESARNPFASLAAPAEGAAREMSAETKVYEVPRELIEIARARASGAEPAGKTTPLAPRPDAELEATLRAYTARLSTKPPRLPSVLLDEALAEEWASDPAASSATDRSMPKPPVASERRALMRERRPSSRRSAVGGSAALRSPHAASGSRAWMVYAALSLIGLASCLHLLLAP